MTASGNSALDAQAAAGRLSEIYAVDVTTATATCAGCGRDGALAELPLYGGAMATVIRCPSCDTVLMRVVSTPQGTWLEMQGLRHLVVPRI